MDHQHHTLVLPAKEMNRTTITSLQRITFKQHEQEGVLTVIPDTGSGGLDMKIRRVFTISGVPVGGARGNHAHKDCIQVVVCLYGRVSVAVDDGHHSITIILDNPSQGLYIPPGLWNRITFDEPNSVIAVFCDQLYDPADYVHDRLEFKFFKDL